MEELRFPIGKYVSINNANESDLQNWLITINSFYKDINNEVDGLNNQQLEQTYRPNGWTIKQLIHHLADSHMNAYMRFKLALTEDNPIIKPYSEANLANLADYQGSIYSSLKIIDGVHQRWSELLASMTEADFTKTYIHPEFNSEYDLKEAVCQYDWHCRHHLSHIKIAKKN